MNLQDSSIWNQPDKEHLNIPQIMSPKRTITINTTNTDLPFFTTTANKHEWVYALNAKLSFFQQQSSLVYATSPNPSVSPNLKIGNDPYLSSFPKITFPIGIMVKVFINGLGDQVSIPGRVIPKTQKIIHDASLLNTPHYKVQIKGKWRKKLHPPRLISVVTIEKGAFGSASNLFYCQNLVGKMPICCL